MIIFIESNTSGSGISFLNYCKKLKIKYFFLTQNPKKYRLNKKVNYIKCDTNNINELIKICKNLIKKNNIKAIFSTSDYYVISAYKLSNFFKLYKNNLNFLNICRNKIELLKLLKKKGYIKRKFGKFEPRKKFNCQIIIKPNSGTGSINIRKYPKETIFNKDNINNLKGRDFYIYEEYIKGQEYSLELFFYKNNIVYKQLIKKETNSKFV